MSLTISDEEFRAVMRLPMETRYEYCVKRVVDQELVWSLAAAGGWALLADLSGTEVIPIWPQPAIRGGLCDWKLGYLRSPLSATRRLDDEMDFRHGARPPFGERVSDASVWRSGSNPLAPSPGP